MAPEPAELVLERRDTWLIARGTGPFTPAWLLEAIKSMGQALKAAPAEALLVDLSAMDGGMADPDRYRAAVEAANQAAYIPVALIRRAAFLDPQRLGEVVARNRGVNMRIFEEPDRAQQ